MATTGVARVVANAGARLSIALSTTTVSTSARLTATRATAKGFTTARIPGPRSAATVFTTARIPAPRSVATVFAALPAAGGRRRPGVRSRSHLMPLQCAPDTPPAPPSEALPPKESLSKTRQVLNKFWAEVKTHGFSWALLLGSLFAGYMATKNHGIATSLLNLCEKGEKVYKFASHFLPLMISIIKCFW